MRPAAEQRCGGNLPSSRPGNPVRCRASVLAGSVCGCAVKRWAARRRTSGPTVAFRRRDAPDGQALPTLSRHSILKSGCSVADIPGSRVVHINSAKGSTVNTTTYPFEDIIPSSE